MAVVITFAAMMISPVFGQVSPEEHAKHHPGQAKSSEKGGMMGGKGGGMMGGEGGGMMGDMMKKMGAPKPKELYPKLMDLPDMPMEERAKIQLEAHERMIDGTKLLSSGLDELAAATATDDFQTMQNATSKMREGLARFESGLAAHRAIAEGKAPRNIALQWFKREMNLQPNLQANSGFRLFGMTPFHTTIMALLIVFAAAMIWMYFFKMRRATELMRRLAVATPSGDIPAADSVARSDSSAEVLGPAPKAAAVSPLPVSASESTSGELDCCSESAVACADEEAGERTDISTGVLRVARRKLCRLRVARIFRETADVKTFRLVACHGGALPFSYLPGQFLTLKLPAGEKPVRRSYTISSSPTQGYFCEISVKREEQGVGSCYLHDLVKEGDTLEAQAPNGKFTFTGTEADSIVLISGGVGITPMVSITRALTDMCWDGEIFFVVACRDSEHFIFKAELERLQERNANLRLFVAMSRIEEPFDSYYAGRLTQERLALWVPDIASKRIHLCGAPPMMEATREMLAGLGVPADRVHTENFGSQQKPHLKASQRLQAAPATEAEPQDATAVTFSMSGKSTSLRADETVLDAAERAGVDIDYSCRTGMCGVCKIKLLTGNVTMEVEDGLEPDDQAAGMVLACQAKSETDITVEA